MAAINLLPTDFLLNPSVLKLAKLLRSVVTLSLAIFVIAGAGLIAYFLINSMTLNVSLKNQEALKSSIKSLEQTEQGLFLVKDRLGKAQEIFAEPSVKVDIDALGKMLTSLPSDATLTQADFNKSSLETTFSVNNSLTLVKLMAGVVSQTIYSRVELLSFSFNPAAGYIASLSFSNK